MGGYGLEMGGFVGGDEVGNINYQGVFGEDLHIVEVVRTCIVWCCRCCCQKREEGDRKECN